MAETPFNSAAQKAPPRFVSLSTLLAPGGLFSMTFDPPPSRRSLNRLFRRAGLVRWKCNGAYGDGRGEPFFERSAVEAWVRSNFSPAAPEPLVPGNTGPGNSSPTESLNPSSK
jgi:hypothetical protein